MDSAKATVGAILDDGAAALGITVDRYEGRVIRVSDEVGGVSFFVDDATEGRSKGRRFYPTVDGSGAVRWDEDITTVTLDRALAASTLRLFPGDPRKIYLVPQSPAGAFDGLDWSQTLQYLKAGEDVLARIGADVAGAAAVCAALRTTWKGARSVLKRLSRRWASRGGSVSDIEAIAGQERRSDEIAKLLGCTIEDAATLVEFFRNERTADDDAPTLGLLRALRQGVETMSAAGFEFLPEWERSADQALGQIARDVLEGRELTDEEVRTRMYRVVNPRYGDWDD